jgi:hypothetical protein
MLMTSYNIVRHYFVSGNELHGKLIHHPIGYGRIDCPRIANRAGDRAHQK